MKLVLPAFLGTKITSTSWKYLLETFSPGVWHSSVQRRHRVQIEEKPYRAELQRLSNGREGFHLDSMQAVGYEDSCITLVLNLLQRQNSLRRRPIGRCPGVPPPPIRQAHAGTFLSKRTRVWTRGKRDLPLLLKGDVPGEYHTCGTGTSRSNCRYLLWSCFAETSRLSCLLTGVGWMAEDGEADSRGLDITSWGPLLAFDPPALPVSLPSDLSSFVPSPRVCLLTHRKPSIFILCFPV